MLQIALSAYDTTLSLSREIDCIWRRRPSFVTLIYVSQRYGTLLKYILDAILEFWIPESSNVGSKCSLNGIEDLRPSLPDTRGNTTTQLPTITRIDLCTYSCRALYKVFGTNDILIIIGSSGIVSCTAASVTGTRLTATVIAFQSLRVWAICDRAWLPLLVVLVPSLVAPAVNIVRRLMVNQEFRSTLNALLKYNRSIPGKYLADPNLGCIFLSARQPRE